MNYANLAVVLRTRADQITADVKHPVEHRQDDAELMRVLARILEGKSIDRAFGAPGDWGYSHPIGAALAAAYKAR